MNSWEPSGLQALDDRIIVVSRYGSEEIGPGLLRRIAIDLRMSAEEFAKIVDGG